MTKPWLAGQECGGGFLTKMLDSFEEADGRQVFCSGEGIPLKVCFEKWLKREFCRLAPLLPWFWREKTHGFLYFPLTFSLQTRVSQWKWCHPLAVPFFRAHLSGQATLVQTFVGSGFQGPTTGWLSWGCPNNVGFTIKTCSWSKPLLWVKHVDVTMYDWLSRNICSIPPSETEKFWMHLFSIHLTLVLLGGLRPSLSCKCQVGRSMSSGSSEKPRWRKNGRRSAAASWSNLLKPMP